VTTLTENRKQSQERWERIPNELVELQQWVAWRAADRPGTNKPAKIPVDPKTGKNADVSNPVTWGTFAEAKARCLQEELYGVGFVLTDEDSLVCVDVDNCRDPRTKELTETARRFLESMNSYAEVSPSGTGVHIWVQGDVPRNARQGGIEIYKTGRFITVTGRHLNLSSPPTVALGGPALENLFRSIASEIPSTTRNANVATPTRGGITQTQLTRVVTEASKGPDGAKFRNLWKGDWSGYPSRSEADLALCRILALHTAYRKNWIDALFRRSGLFRDKWDRRTYGQVTVRKAISEARSVLKKRWGIKSGSDVREVGAKPVEYLIDGLVPRGTLVVLVGNSGLGKSPLTYQLGLCVGSGIDFLGRKTRVGRVLMLDYENGAAEASGIVETQSKYLGIEGSLERFLYWTRDDATPRWRQKSGPFGMIRDFKPDLVIIDSLSAFNPQMEETNANANRIIAELRNISRESGCAVLMTHHRAKPSRKAVVEPLEISNLSTWMWQARGASAIINSTDVRLAVDKPFRRPASSAADVEEIALVMRGLARVRGEIPLMYIARVFDRKGQPIGYRNLTGPELLFNPQQEAAFDKLPSRFRFKDARLIYQRTDQPTADFLKKCESLKIIIRRVDGGYEKINATPQKKAA
jgi:hypothetical protein